MKKSAGRRIRAATRPLIRVTRVTKIAIKITIKAARMEGECRAILIENLVKTWLNGQVFGMIVRNENC